MTALQLIGQLQKDVDKHGDFDIEIAVYDSCNTAVECSVDDNWEYGYIFDEHIHRGCLYARMDTFMEDLEEAVRDWFYDNCGEDGYDSESQRIEDFEAMIDGCNDIMVDNCISRIEYNFDVDLETYRDDIENILIQLCKDEL